MMTRFWMLCDMIMCLVAFIICPIAIAYSYGTNNKIGLRLSVCVCVCVSVCPCVVTLTVAFLCQFSPNLTQRCNPQKEERVRWGSISPHSFPYFTLKNRHFSPWKSMQIWKTQYLPKMFTYRQNTRVLREIGVGERDGDVGFLRGSRNMSVSRMRNEKMQFGTYLWPNCHNSYIL